MITTHEIADAVGGNFTTGARNEYLQYSDWGWAFDPDGLQYYLEMIYDRYQRPLMVVENGLGAFEIFNMPSARSFGISLKANF